MLCMMSCRATGGQEPFSSGSARREQMQGRRTHGPIGVDGTLLGYFDMHGMLLVFPLSHFCSLRIRGYRVGHSTAGATGFNHGSCVQSRRCGMGVHMHISSFLQPVPTHTHTRKRKRSSTRPAICPRPAQPSSAQPASQPQHARRRSYGRSLSATSHSTCTPPS